MISTDEFLTRLGDVTEDRAKARDRHLQLFKELQALAVLTGCTVYQSGDLVSVNDPNGQLVMTGPMGEVVETLVTPPPDDAPFSIFTTAGPSGFPPGAPAGFLRGLRLQVDPVTETGDDRDEDSYTPASVEITAVQIDIESDPGGVARVLAALPL